ncbi:MAG: glycosyltransferase family 4 protein [Candidatus Hydrogenedentes bacterium]|nr:glycosyltransferase family 4 protein [Candidatus Hydrogenedentota bacterium]
MNQPLRVLLVPDVPYWICGTIARAIATHTPGIDATLCSGPVLRALPGLERYAGHFDLAHFLTPQDANKTIDAFCGRIATVTTIHHVQGASSMGSVDRADAVMTASRQWYGRLCESGVDEQKLAIVPYGIQAETFRPPAVEEKPAIRAALGLDPGCFTIGFVGKRSSDAGGRKGTDTFVKGMRVLLGMGHVPQVLIVGPGWGEFIASLSSSGVQCLWKPFVVGEAEFAALYRAMDVYWCTSTIEGGPVPVLEAMASGVCCLSTQVGMVPEAIRNGENGFLLPFDDAPAFAACTATLMGDPTRCASIARAAVTTIINGYRWEQSALHATELYATAFNNFSNRIDRVSPSTPLRPWPAAWIAAEERRMTEDFIHDAHHPPGATGRLWRQIRNSRWVRNWSARISLH